MQLSVAEEGVVQSWSMWLHEPTYFGPSDGVSQCTVIYHKSWAYPTDDKCSKKPATRLKAHLKETINEEEGSKQKKQSDVEDEFHLSRREFGQRKVSQVKIGLRPREMQSHLMHLHLVPISSPTIAGALITQNADLAHTLPLPSPLLRPCLFMVKRSC